MLIMEKDNKRKDSVEHMRMEVANICKNRGVTDDEFHYIFSTLLTIENAMRARRMYGDKEIVNNFNARGIKLIV